MARMRSVKPEYWTDEDIATATCRDARLLYVAMWNLADEHARLRGDPRYIKGQVFAYDDDLSPDVIDKLLDELAAIGKVVRYRVAGARYLFLPKLGAHQRLEPDKTPSRLPAPEDADPEPEPPSGNFPDKSARSTDESAQKRTFDERRSEPSPDQREESGADDSEKIPDESALARARSFKHVAGSREHVAGIPPTAGDASAAASEAQIVSGEILPTGSTGAVERVNGGTLLAQWIDHCAANGVKLPKRVKGHYATRIKGALDEGFDELTIKRALAQLLDQGDAGRPSLLDNKLIDVQNGPRRRPRTLTPGEEGVQRMLDQTEDGAQVIELFRDALGMRGTA
jgi:hypothetical protein